MSRRTVFKLVKGPRKELRFKDGTGDECALYLGPPSPRGVQPLCLENSSGSVLQLTPELAWELAWRLTFYSDNAMLAEPPPPPRKEWLVCPRCGKKRYRKNVRWIEDGRIYLGERCSACKHTCPVYALGSAKKRGK